MVPLRTFQRLSLYLFLFSINFETWDPLNTDGSFSISKLTGLLYFASLLPDARALLNTQGLRHVLRPAWLFFVVLTLVSLLNTNDVSSRFFDASIFQCIVLFWILVNHEREDPLVLEKGMISYALGSAVTALLFEAGIGAVYVEGRVSILGENQNTIGIKMVISMAVFLLAIIQNRLKLGPRRWLFLVPVPIMMHLMAETGSRVAFISYALVFAGGIVLLRTKNISRKVGIMALGSIAALFTGFVLVQSGVLGTRLENSLEGGDLAHRDMIWESLEPLIEQHPVFGVGETGYAHYTALTYGGVKSPHNVFLEVLCYSGAVGLFCYGLYLFQVAKYAVRSYRRSGYLLPLLLLVPIMGELVSGQMLWIKTGWVVFAYMLSSSLFTAVPQHQQVPEPINEHLVRYRVSGLRRRRTPVG
jgi:O-antigen ligase